ncbi:kinase-like domain-containing protein [Glomus cerebriforme]|uniref:Kinase-like domain-containing protein n=1 Tax=Glomus cerebriforme TaxID=658196 RepID=A0A397SI78_9GLOM|nr:kinase-like domain-containing protein [Glomus cerebriforme]
MIHVNIHDGNIFLENNVAIIGDLKNAIIKHNEDIEVYGIIPFIAPEVFQGQKYTKASDIYSFGMIMWELITGRMPFWDKNHDIGLIFDICDGLHPPIVTNAPEGYIELMKKCWHSDRYKRPTAAELKEKIRNILLMESDNCHENSPTKIIKSSDIGPISYNLEDYL